ncbi:hypothetical protein [Mesoaciditoga sp.]
MLTLKGAKVFNGEEFIENKDFHIELSSQEEKELNLDGMWILPGLIDTHVHLRVRGNCGERMFTPVPKRQLMGV